MNGSEWFGPEWAWIPGTALGVMGGLFGSLLGLLAPRGRARGVMVMFHSGLIAVSGVLLGAGLVALAKAQPYGVWYALVLPGGLGLVLFLVMLPVTLIRYREAELRRSVAQDL